MTGSLRIIRAAAIVLASATLAAAAPPPADPTPALWRAEGDTVWIDIPVGRMKTRVYRSAELSEHPVLLLVVHGDIPVPRADSYEFARRLAHMTSNVVAVGVLRPGYKDADGDVSSGEMGYAIGDNYTPEVVDALDAAILKLKAQFHARAVILVGHSGGGSIDADLMGRHPGDADAALLAACGCDPREFMTRWIATHPKFPKNLPNPSLLPIELAPRVSPAAHVRMVIGGSDDVVRLPDSQAYAAALQARGVDVKLTVVPGVGHNEILFSRPTFQALFELVTLEGGTVPPPPRSPGDARAPGPSSGGG